MSNEETQPKKRGRPCLPPGQKRTYRGNLLLTSEEARLFKTKLDELTAKAGRRVTGTEFIRSVVLPLLCDDAQLGPADLLETPVTPDV